MDEVIGEIIRLFNGPRWNNIIYRRQEEPNDPDLLEVQEMDEDGIIMLIKQSR